MPVARGTVEHRFEIVQESLALGRIGPAQQLLGLLPGQLQAMQGGADRLAAAGPAKPLTHPANQTAQRPARRWIGSGYRRGCGGALGGTDCFAKGGLDLRAKIL